MIPGTGSLPLDEKIINEYDLRVSRIEGGLGSWRLATDRGQKALYSIKSRERAEFILSFTEYLAAHGYRKIPRFIKTKYGQSMVTGRDGSIYYLVDLLDVRPVKLSSMEDGKKVVHTLALLHQMGKELASTQEISDQGAGWADQIAFRCDEFLDFKSNAFGQGKKTFFNRLFLPYGDYFYEQAQKSLNLLKSSAYQESLDSGGMVLCIRDFREDKIGITPRGEVYFNNFNYILPDLFVCDLARLLRRCLPQHRWKWSVGQSLLEEYQKVQALSGENLKILLGLLYFPRKFWLAGRRYYQGKPGWSEKELANLLKDSIKEEKARASFLTRLANTEEIS